MYLRCLYIPSFKRQNSRPCIVRQVSFLDKYWGLVQTRSASSGVTPGISSDDVVPAPGGAAGMWFNVVSICNLLACFHLFLFPSCEPFDCPAISQLAIYTAVMAAISTQCVPPKIEYAIFDMDGLLST